MPNSHSNLLHTMKIFFACLAFVFLWIGHCSGQNFTKARKKQLLSLLGNMPDPPLLKIDTLEATPLENGWRYKIEYLVEKADAVMEEPEDRIRAYLFIPAHRPSEKLPAIIAIHQDGPRAHVGKAEPAGLGGDKDQHYGYELFKRGYVVICPDRFYHAERRRIPPNDTASINIQRDISLLGHRAGQLLIKGQNTTGKEVYDLMRATDVLYALPNVDTKRIGAIGHSAGGNILIYFMFADQRIKAGISSCGFFDPIRFFSEKAPRRRMANGALPGLAKVGKGADYLAFIAPRPVLLTRGLWEWGNYDEYTAYSQDHVQETKEMVHYAQQNYTAHKASGALDAIYFDEEGGNHAFPPKVKEQAYQWLDKYLKKK